MLARRQEDYEDASSVKFKRKKSKECRYSLATRARDLVVRVIIDGVRRMHLVIQSHATPLDLDLLHEAEAVDHGLDVVIEVAPTSARWWTHFGMGPTPKAWAKGIREGAAVFPE